MTVATVIATAAAESMVEMQQNQNQQQIIDDPTGRKSFLHKARHASQTKRRNVTQKEAAKELRRSASMVFKYRFNLSKKDIEEIRRLLTIERTRQDGEEFEFFTPDYERMMKDDWLITRFLLRGMKAPSATADVMKGHQIYHDTIQPQSTDVYANTLELIKQCAKFRYDYHVNSRTKESDFPYEWIRVNGLFSYKPDLEGNPTVYLRVALHRPKSIESDELRHLFKRFMLYTLECCDNQLYNKPGKAVCCVFDMTNVSLENIDLELTTWMIKSFKNCGPKLVCYVIIYNAPWFFTATFRLICNTLLSNSKRQSLELAYGKEILNYIEYDNLPDYIKTSIC